MFNPDDYEPVAVRLDRWLENRADQEPRVVTHCVEYSADHVLFRAELYLGDRLIATGWAEERRTERGINAGSMVEVGETSSLGRALANAGMAGSDPRRRASREEMQKAQRYERPPQASGGSQEPTEAQLGAIRRMAAQKGYALTEAALSELTKFTASDLIGQLKEMPNVS